MLDRRYNPDGKLEWHTVILHDASRCQIAKEFFHYYRNLGLILVYRRWPQIGFLRHDLKAKCDDVNGGLKFWLKVPTPIEATPYRPCPLDSWIMDEGDKAHSQPGWGYYDKLQLAWRELHGRFERRKRMQCKNCEARFEIPLIKVGQHRGLCRKCERLADTWNKILVEAGKIASNPAPRAGGGDGSEGRLI